MTVTYYKEPDAKTGYRLDPDDSFWHVCVAEASENLFTDPTLETAGTSVTSVKFLPFTAAAAGAYTFSCYVRNVVRLIMQYGPDENTAISSVTREVPILLRSQWSRQEFTFRIDTPDDYVALINVEYVGAGGQTNWWQLEAKGYSTTYFDGSFGMWFPYAANEYRWTGTPYASTSTRSAATRSGGRYVSLEEAGFHTVSVMGLGPQRYDYSFASNLNGTHYLESARQQQREFTIGGNIYGCSFSDLNHNRTVLTELLRPDYLGKAEPLRLRMEFEEGFQYELSAYVLEGLEGEVNNRHQQAYAVRFKTAEEGAFMAQGDVADASLYGTGNMILAGRNEHGTWTNYDYDDNNQTFPCIVRSIDHDYQGNIYIGGTIAGYVHKVRVAGSNASTMLGTDWNDEFATQAGPIQIAVSKTAPVYVMAVGFQKRNSLICTGTALWKESTGEWEDLNSGADITCCRWAAGKFYVGGTNTVAGQLAVACYDPVQDQWGPIGGGLDSQYAQECWAMEVGPDGYIYMTGWFNHPSGFFFLMRYDPVMDKIEYLSRINNYPTFQRTDYFHDITFDSQGRIYVACYIEEDPIDDRSVWVGHGMQFEKRQLYSRTTSTTHKIDIEGADSNFYVSGFVQAYGNNQPYYRYNAIHRVWSSYGTQALTPFDFLYPVASEPEYVPIHVIRDKLYFAPNVTAGYKWGTPTVINYTGTAPTRLRMLINGPVTLYSIWNWTTRKQIVLNRPIVVPEYARAAVFTQNGVLFSLNLSDASLLPQPLSLNPGASDSQTLDLVPGENRITAFYEVGPTMYGPWVKFSWRNAYHAL